MKRKGFSLIELLVVISIIASIVALAIPNYLSARQRANDSKKKSEMASLKTALRLYYNDYAKYPKDSGVALHDQIQGCGAAGEENCNRVTCPNLDFAAGGAGCDVVYMKQFPTGFGPNATTKTIYYYQTTGVDDFCLRAVLDNKSDTDIVTSQARCASACGGNCTGGASSGRYCVCAD